MFNITTILFILTQLCNNQHPFNLPMCLLFKLLDCKPLSLHHSNTLEEITKCMINHHTFSSNKSLYHQCRLNHFHNLLSKFRYSRLPVEFLLMMSLFFTTLFLGETLKSGQNFFKIFLEMIQALIEQFLNLVNMIAVSSWVRKMLNFKISLPSIQTRMEFWNMQSKRKLWQKWVPKRTWPTSIRVS